MLEPSIIWKNIRKFAMKKKITRSYMSKALLSTAIAAVIPLFFVSEAKAGINVFFPDGYENSAAMSMTSKFDLTLGNSFVQNRSKYKGTTYGVTGQSSSTLNTPFMPHGHLLYRISPVCQPTKLFELF
jgi:hypothetical protein